MFLNAPHRRHKRAPRWCVYPATTYAALVIPGARRDTLGLTREIFAETSLYTMDGQMSHYPPPDQSYSSAYPAATAAQQSTSPSAVDHLQLSAALEQSQYSDNSGYSKLEEQIANFQNEGARDGTAANGGMADRAHQQSATGAPAPPGDGQARPNRLRKACDACSVRKVKVCDTLSMFVMFPI